MDRSQTIERDERLTKRLLWLALRPRPIHNEPEVVVPDGLSPIAVAQLFPDSEQSRRRVLELGSGWGEFAVEWLRRNPSDAYLAMEVKGDRIRRMLRDARRSGSQSLHVLPINFSWFLEELLPERCFDIVFINFPDPWPKRRHWKHRLIRSGFPARLENLLRPGGTVHIATDYGPYARKILQAFRRDSRFRPLLHERGYVRLRPRDLPGTRFEEIHVAAGRRPYYQRWQLNGPTVAQTFPGPTQ